MKTKLTTVIAVAVLASASFGFGSTGAAPKATTTVEFIEPENYTDFKTSWSGFDADRESLEASLIARIEREVARSLPAGYHLAVKFRDIDMAGDFEPWRSVHFSDVRILRSSTPPRMFFDYALTDARGEIVSSGERRLIDMTYDMRLRPFFREGMDIEGELMGDFISRLARDVRRPAG